MCCNGSFLYKIFRSKSNKNNKLHYIMVHVTIKLLKLNEWFDLLLWLHTVMPWHWLNQMQWLFFLESKSTSDASDKLPIQNWFLQKISKVELTTKKLFFLFASPRTKFRKFFFYLLWGYWLYKSSKFIQSN